MLLEEIIKPDSVLCNAFARSKKHSIEILSELLVRPTPEFAAEDIFERLIERERLGCTSLEAGVAFPHCRVEGLERSSAAMIKLSEPVEFDAADGEPVDLIFGMLVPKDLDESHVEEVKGIARVLGEEGLRARLRESKTSNELYETLLEGSQLAGPATVRAAQGR
ncbi:MAG: PTS sugar transporter subunit IIA [Woeseiaceae bacterium]|nr:PTS sugar transporter subunit IIA [Woeseiaceae bacterium]